MSDETIIEICTKVLENYKLGIKPTPLEYVTLHYAELTGLLLI